MIYHMEEEKHLVKIYKKNVQKEIINILQKLNNLILLFKTQLIDFQFISEQYFKFALDYVSVPQLHMTLISKLDSQHREKK